MSKFKYSGYTRDDVDRNKRDRKSNFDSFATADCGFFKASEGANTIRILPPSFEDDNRRLFGLKVYVHYNIGVDKSAYLCLNKMQNKPCPICEERNKLSPETDEEYIRELNCQGKLLIYVLDRTAPDKGPLLWTIPNAVLDDILDDSEDEKTGELLNIDHPDEGFDVSFTAVGAGKRTCKYKKVRVAREPTSIAEDDSDYNYLLDFLEKNPLNKILNYYSFEHIAAKFGAESEEDSTPRRERTRAEPESEEESPRRGRRTATTSEPESEEEESPRRGRARTKPEPEPESEEDASPRRGRRSAPEPEPENEEEDDSDPLPDAKEPEKEVPETAGSRLSRFRKARTAK